MTPFNTIWPNFIIVYPINSSHHHMIWFLHCVPNWLLSSPFNLILSYVPNWLLSRPFDPILPLCTPMTPFNTIWTNFIIVYPINFIQDHIT